ncbi:putative glucan endo-1,3-alpha-glucosidase agn1 [Amylocarpus encephaloides]|uniref:Glucan endo-1,3-alpha-glucosidase agn1 n=1 Tax=Amylocarpus encephaloides TaxID=45428 RepID=A0A9P7Y8Z3_9HELO|nr:putative glucan endo-1,3-alpha-glucosidase agn1 [Amylocarpus encephaloides]
MGGITEDHIKQDIDDAMNVGFDGFGINIGDPTQSWIPTPLENLFGYAETRGFKLFISLDVSATASACAGGSIGACGGPNSYHDLLSSHLASTAWFKGANGLPMISTFSSGGWEAQEWTAWRDSLANKMYFVPEFDDTANYYQDSSSWWDYWGSTVEGLFSWDAAWPSGSAGNLSEGDISPEQNVMEGAASRGKGYMMAISTLQYKNANDGPESHYIGNIWPEASTDPASAKYATQILAPHTSWLPLISSFITAYKTSSPMYPPSSTPAVGAMWHSTILSTADCPSDTKPSGFSLAKDQINWSIVLPSTASGYTVSLVSGCEELGSVKLMPGLNYGATSTIKPGRQRMVVTDEEGKVVLAASNRRDVSAGCPDGIYNMNPQVVGLGDDASADEC